MNFFTEKGNEDRLNNLIILRDYIKEYYNGAINSKTFDMAYYCRSTSSTALFPYQAECGTICCALGHGPQAGIPQKGIENLHWTWRQYADQYFCPIQSKEWEFLFGSRWQSDIQQFINRASIVISGQEIDYDFWNGDYLRVYKAGEHCGEI